MKQKRVIFTFVIVALMSINIAMVSQSVNGKIIDPELPPTHPFICKGYVRTTSGVAISGATVVVSNGNGIYKSTSTSSTGYYYISIQTTIYAYCDLEVSKSGFIPQSKSVYSKGTNTNDFSLVGEYHTFVCKGYVENKDGTALSGASVEVIGSGISGSDDTSSSGYYYISIYTRTFATCTITASANGYSDQQESVYSNGINTINFDLEVEVFTFTCSGYARDTDGMPLVGTIISIIGSDFTATAYSDLSGYYSLTAETSFVTSCDITASKANFESDIQTILTEPGSHSVDFVLTSIHTLHAVVETIHLGAFFPHPFNLWVYRDFYLDIVTIYTNTIYEEEYIIEQNIRLYSVDSFFAPPDTIVCTVTYNDGTNYFWKAYSPDIFHLGYLEISTADDEAQDSFHISGKQTNTMLCMHISCTYNGIIEDLGTKTYEYIL